MNFRSCRLPGAALLVFVFAGLGLVSNGAPAQTAPAGAAAATAPVAAGPKGTAPAPAATVRRAPSDSGRTFDTRLREIRQRGTLIVGMASFVPWAINDPKAGWLGFEVDVAHQLAADLGVDLKIVELPFSRLIEATRIGEIDLVASGMSITPRRALSVAFTQPYGRSTMDLTVRKDDAAFTNWDRDDAKIAAREGTVGESIVNDRFPHATLVAFKSDNAMFAALTEGKVDAVVSASPQSRIRMALAPDTIALAAGSGDLPKTVEGFAVRRGEPSLVNFLNAWIAYWGADGWLEERRRHWFDTLDWIDQLSH